jgi:hypothetical protein
VEKNGKPLADFWDLPVARDWWPDRPGVLFNRQSGWDQAIGDDGRDLAEAKMEKIMKAALEFMPAYLILPKTFTEVEGGKTYLRHVELKRAADYAWQNGAMLIARSPNRYVRPSDYHPIKNPHALLTQWDRATLYELTKGLILATTGFADASEEEQHSLAIKMGANAPGRQRRIDNQLAAKIFDMLGCFFIGSDGKWHWDRSIEEAAKIFNVSKSQIQRASEELLSPAGRTWRQEGILKAQAAGLLEIGQGREIVIKVPMKIPRGWREGKRGRPPKAAYGSVW